MPVYWAVNSSAPGSGSDAWRCDMHPSVSRDGRWVLVNARPDAGLRQVVLAYIGDLVAPMADK
jgi:hypothetical protein